MIVVVFASTWFYKNRLRFVTTSALIERIAHITAEGESAVSDEYVALAKEIGQRWGSLSPKDCRALAAEVLVDELSVIPIGCLREGEPAIYVLRIPKEPAWQLAWRSNRQLEFCAPVVTVDGKPSAVEYTISDVLGSEWHYNIWDSTEFGSGPHVVRVGCTVTWPGEPERGFASYDWKFEEAFTLHVGDCD